jgi:hypothetical protein
MRKTFASLIVILVVLSPVSASRKTMLNDNTRSVLIHSNSFVQRQVRSLSDLFNIANNIGADRLLKRRLNAPQLLFENNTFTFYQGDDPVLTDKHGFTSPSEMPLLIPLTRYIQISDLRQFIASRRDVDQAFWQPYFEVAEMLIQHSLDILAAGKYKEDELVNRLKAYDFMVGNIFSNVTGEEYAVTHNLKWRAPTLASVRGGHSVTVSFSINPENGAHLFVVSETAFLIAGQLQTEPLWNEILSATEQLGGCYFYRVIWPDQTTTGPNRFCVESENQKFEIRK